MCFELNLECETANRLRILRSVWLRSQVYFTTWMIRTAIFWCLFKLFNTKTNILHNYNNNKHEMTNTNTDSKAQSNTNENSRVDAKNVLNTQQTGEFPQNVNQQPDASGNSEPREGGASDISAKEEINTHDSGEPSADNVNVSGKVSGYDDAEQYSSNDSNPKEGGASDISAKEEINTHGSGEPSADNVNVQADSQAGN